MTLLIQLTGPPEVIFQGEPLKFRSRKVLALLLFLVVEGGAHRREKITALLWPESDETRARASLRNTLLRLRQSLEPAGEYLISNTETISFDFSLPHKVFREPPGEFLEGLSLPEAPDFDHWLSLQRETYRQRLEKHLEEQTKDLLQYRNFHDAIETATRWLARDPLNETATRDLMRAHALAGDRTSALTVYTTLSRALKDELDLTPSLELAALAETIRQTSLEPQSPITTLPFAGRRAEYDQLAAACERAFQGVPQAVCVEGEAGIGKTRLVETFLDWAALQGPVDLLRGRAFEIGGQLPYQPLVDALRHRVEAENAPDDLLPDVWLAELSQLLPELRNRYPDFPQPLTGNPEFTRSRLFEAVAVLGQALAQRKPLVLFVDDLQWADPGTLDMLHYLVRRWAEARVRMCFFWTVRIENLASSATLREWFSQIGLGIPLNRVPLAPLGEGEVCQLVASLTSADQAEDQAIETFSDWLQRETDGQPFFVTEMLKMLEERGILTGGDFARALRTLHETGRSPVPPTVRGLILARSGRLSESASAFLLAAAVVGREASFDVLCQIAGSDEVRGIDAIEELFNSRLLVETGFGERPYRFTHDNIRDVMYTEAGEARRRVYHRRAFSSLERTASAAKLALHAHAGWMAKAAFEYSFAAGDEAIRKYAYAEAVTQCTRALKWVAHVKAPPEECVNLYVRRGRALELNGQYTEALAHYQAQNVLDETDGAWAALQGALVLCEEASLRWKKRQIHVLLAEIAEARNQKETARQFREQARKIIDWIADQIDVKDLRTSFLSQPEGKMETK